MSLARRSTAGESYTAEVQSTAASESYYILESNGFLEQHLSSFVFDDETLGRKIVVGFGDGRFEESRISAKGTRLKGEGQATENPIDAQEKVYDHKMSDMNREELNAKLEAVEARMDSRVASIEGKIDAFIAVQAEQIKQNERRFETYERDVRDMRAEIKSDFKSLKSAIIVTAITTVLAIVIGVASFNATLTSNMLAAFQVGKEYRSPPPAIPVNK